MGNYQNEISAAQKLIDQNGNAWGSINAEYAARMRMQNRFQNGIEIAKYTADIMRADMDAYDADSSNSVSYTHLTLPTIYSV